MSLPLARSAFEGMQPVLRQSPPHRARLNEHGIESELCRAGSNGKARRAAAYDAKIVLLGLRQLLGPFR